MNEKAEGTEVCAPRAWLTVAILFLTYIASFADRAILSLLVDPIRRDLHLGDVQIGLLAGLAFGVFYAILALPLGWLADRVSRRMLIAAGVSLWSLATVACGLATDFRTLFAARMFVGIGEAALAPAALSLIAGSFPPERRGLPIAVFVMAGSVGGGVALALGGQLVAALGAPGAEAWRLFGDRAPWRNAFLALGCLGPPLAGLTFAIDEPRRAAPTIGAVGDAVRTRWDVLIPLYAAMALLSVIAYGYLAWTPSLLMRRFGWDVGRAGLAVGTLLAVSGAAGVVLGGALAQSRGQTPARAALRVVFTGLVLLGVPAGLAPIVPGAGWTLAGLAPVLFLFAFPSGAAVAAVQALTSAHQRGQVIALYYLTINLFGMSAGAPIMAFVGERLGGLAIGVAATSAVCTPAAALCGWAALKRTRLA